MSIETEAMLELLTESESAVAALQAKVSALESENASLKEQLASARDIRSLLEPRVIVETNREIKLTVTARDASERISEVTVKSVSNQ